MEGMRLTLPFLFLAALAHQTIALKCNAGCVGNSGNVFNYQPGTVYKYELDGASVMSLTGADGDVAKMTVKAAADVAALPNCAYSVSLTNFQISTKDGKNVDGDKGQPVVFSMNNGVVQSDICSSKDEPTDTLNIKRAIISLLQSSSNSNSKSEIDIFGTCPTDTNVHKSGSKLKVKKIKNLTTCSHRQNILLPYAVTHYHSLSDLQSVPWISASQKVDQDVDGQVKWAMSKEEYVMPPGTGAESGATLTITTKLTLKGTGGGAAAPEGIEKEKSIILGVKEVVGDNSKHAAKILKDVCEGSKKDAGIQLNNANKYLYLTYLLSKSTKATMMSLYNQVKQGQICDDKDAAKKILFDSIYDSQSAGGAQAMVELLKNKEVTGLKAQLWYASLGNVKHATVPSLKSATGLIDGDSPNEAYIGAGSLLGRYCHDHTCEGVPEVNQLQKKLSGPLTKGCKASSLAEEDKLLASIKGLGNSGYLSGPVTKQLIQCATDHSVRSRVRSAALDALHADPNKENVKKAAIGLLKDMNEDSEIRIKAYLIIAECPCGKMAGIIKEVLDKEESFQVGNFIVSHLRNIRASKNPDKAKAKAHFSGISTSKSFPFDLRKYSTNLETSYMLESLNFGGSVESNVIYSQKSWIPKSVCVNVTSQLFGNSFNVLEMDIRTENLEKMIEKLAGPKGYLSGDPDSIDNDIHKFFKEASQRGSQTFRPKRGVSQNDLDALAKQVNLGADFGETDESLDLSVKMFGSEVAWVPLHGAQLDHTPSESVNDGFSILDGILNKAKNLDFHYTKHKILAEGAIAYPTAMGVPLKIKAVVSLAIQVKMDGQVDIPAIMRDPHNALLKFQVIPSGSLVGGVISMMESSGVHTGIKVTATAHSSTGSDVTVRVLEGKGVDVKVGLPLAKQEVLTLKTDITAFSDSPHGKVANPVTFNTKREEFSGCFDQVSEFVGLTFCGEVSAPWDGHRIISPAYGPVKLSARIEKEDPSLTNFHFKAFYNIQKDAPQHHFEIVLDTPNSKKERRLGLVVENTMHPNLAFKASLVSPVGNVKIDTSAINSAEEKSVNAELLFIDQEYVFKAGVKQAGPNKYKPFLEYKSPEVQKSRFSAISGGKQSQQYVTVSGETELNGNKLTLQGVTVTLARQEYVLDGSLWKEPKTSGVDLKIKVPDDELEVKLKAEDLSPFQTKRTWLVSSQKYPDMSISGSWDLELITDKKQTKVKSDVVVIHGADLNTETARITLSNYFHSQNNPKGNPVKVETKNLVLYPVVNLKGVFDFHGDANKLGYNVEGSFETYTGGSTLEIVMTPEYSVDFTNNLLDNNLVVHMKRENAGEDKSKFINSLEMNPGGKYQLNALVTHKFKPEDLDLHVESKITLPSDPKNIEIKAGILDNKDVHKEILWASLDGKNVVDGKVTINKGNEVAGTFSFVLPEFVDSNGKLKYGPTGLDGNAVVHLIKPNKKVEVKTNAHVSSPEFKGKAVVCVDDKCVTLSSESHINQDNFDTKNSLELPSGTAFHVNANGDESKGVHSAEAEAKTSDGHQTKLTYASSRHIRPGDTDVEYIAGFEDVHPGGKPLKLEAKLVGKHIDLDKQTGDGQVIVTYHSPDDQDLSIHTNFKRAPSADEKWISNTEVGVSGSIVGSPSTLKLESELHEKWFDANIEEDGSIPPYNYQLKLDVGQLLSVESHGKGSGHTTSNELHVNLPQANEGIKNFKWTTNNMIDVHVEDHAKIKSSNIVKWDGKFIKTNVDINQEEHGLNFHLDLEGDSIPKKILSGNVHYCIDDESGFCKNDGSVALTWDGKKADISITSEVDTPKKIGSLHVKGTLLDGTKFDLNSKAKCHNQGDQDVSLHGETTAVIGDKKWSGTGTLEIDSTKYNINLILDEPEGQSQFKSLSTKKGDMHWESEYVVKWIANGGGSFVGQSDINVESENNFAIVHNIDAPLMNLNKFHFAAKITPDNKLEVDVKNNGETLAAAKTSYHFTTEGTKNKIEGSGNINIKGKEYPLTYDATFDVKPESSSLLQMELNAKAGERTFKFDSHGKPSHYHVKRTYCKAPGDCSEAEIKYENKVLDPLTYEHTLVYKLDLSLFNPKLSDININSKVKSENLVFNQNLDIDWGSTKVKYVFFAQPNKAGVTLTLPSRTLAAEASYGMPKKDKNGLKLEGSVWLDKAKTPNKKTHLLLIGEVGQNKDLYTAQGEIKFNNPALPKPLIVKGKTAVSASLTKPSGEGSFEIDLFKKAKSKIVGNWKLTGEQTEDGFDASNNVKIKSEELKINVALEQKVDVNKDSASLIEKLTYTDAKGQNKEVATKLELTTNKFHVLVSIPEVTIVDYTAKWALTESSLEASEEIELLGATYSDHLDIHLKPLKVSYKLISNKGCDKPLTAEATFEMGKSTKFDVGFDGHSILVGEVSLAEDHFLKPEVSYDKDAVKNIMHCYEESQIYAGNEHKKILENIIIPQVKEEVESKRDLLKQNVIDWEAVSKVYQEELEKIQDEILSDPNIQGVAGLVKETLSKFFENSVQSIEELQKIYSQAFDEVGSALQDLAKTIHDLHLSVMSSLNELMKAGVGLGKDFTKLLLQLSEAAMNEIASHSDEITAVLKSTADACEEYGKIIYKQTHLIHQDIQDYVEAIANKLQEIPLGELYKDQVEQIKQMIENLEYPDLKALLGGDIGESLVHTLDEIIKQLKESATFPELEQMIETMKTWVQKVLVDKEQIDNVAFTKKISKEFYEVLKKLVELIQEQVHAITQEDPLGKAKLPKLSALPLTKIPSGLLKMSGLTWLTSSDLPSILQVIATYLPSMNPDDWTPPFTARAYLLGGSEIITFDGSHLSVGGDCSYVLTQDYLDGNFSVVGQFKGGKLDALQVSDGHDTVELRHDKKPLVNGKESEFPIFQGQIVSWKRAAAVGLSTKSGLKILCTPDCLRCKFKIDGLYFGRLRGLLGTYNYEQFDEHTLPSGEIADSNEKFLSSWAIGGCSVPNDAAPATREPTCTKTFTDAPDFLACYHLVSPKPYRKACDKLAAKETTPEGLQAAVCNVAFAYSLQCQNRVPTAVPPSCLKCTESKTNLFEKTAKVEPPFKKADVVFALERVNTIEDVYDVLIQTLIPKIKSDLSAKGISDVKFGVVGFGGNTRKWPAYYTNNGEILADNVEKGNLVFEQLDHPKNLKHLIEGTYAEAGLSAKTMTYADLVEFYPWRQGSSKVVLGAHATECPLSKSLFLLQHLYFIGSYINKGITFHTISYVQNMTLPGYDTKKIIAFNDEEVITMKDLEHGDKDAEDKLDFKSDPCFTFAEMTGGNVYPVVNYVNGDQAEKDAFTKVMTKSIVGSLTDTSKQQPQTCSCHPKTNPYDGIFSQSDCRILNV